MCPDEQYELLLNDGSKDTFEFLNTGTNSIALMPDTTYNLTLVVTNPFGKCSASKELGELLLLLLFCFIWFLSFIVTGMMSHGRPTSELKCNLSTTIGPSFVIIIAAAAAAIVELLHIR